MKKRWTEEEKSLLQAIYAMSTDEQLAQAFPDRSMAAIQNQASHLGITQRMRRKTGPPWPGMIGGREAYDMTEAEWKEPPEKHEKRMAKKYGGM